MTALSQTPTEVDYMKDVLYQEVVGALLYAACARRPEISAAVGKVCKFTQNPWIKHCTAICGLVTRIKDRIRLQPEYIAGYIVLQASVMRHGQNTFMVRGPKEIAGQIQSNLTWQSVLKPMVTSAETGGILKEFSARQNEDRVRKQEKQQAGEQKNGR
ncbi:hypothetical protein MP228_005972 [Amoeboaphelidium protococcarum]|nr:hypothetical protein MP228_005972 [Amoeboaphelidium protococcarum]